MQGGVEYLFKGTYSSGVDTDPITQLPTRLREIPDPALRAQAATQLLHVLAEVQQQIKDQRQTDVIELRQSRKLREIGDLLGMSMARVDQIAKGKTNRTATE